jgi:hypothetical protein
MGNIHFRDLKRLRCGTGGGRRLARALSGGCSVKGTPVGMYV